MMSLGIDVSKATLHLCLLREADGKQKTKVIENTRAGIAMLLDWLARQGVERPPVQVILEATGVYHEATTEALHAAGIPGLGGQSRTGQTLCTGSGGAHQDRRRGCLHAGALRSPRQPAGRGALAANATAATSRR